MIGLRRSPKGDGGQLEASLLSAPYLLSKCGPKVMSVNELIVSVEEDRWQTAERVFLRWLTATCAPSLN